MACAYISVYPDNSVAAEGIHAMKICQHSGMSDKDDKDDKDTVANSRRASMHNGSRQRRAMRFLGHKRRWGWRQVPCPPKTVGS